MKPHFHIAIALIWRDGNVLCARRRDDADHLPSVWEFPGGKCRADETLEECVRREVREEIGIEVRVTGTRPAITHDYEVRTVTLHPFACEIVSGEPQALGNASIRWLAPQELQATEFPIANSSLIEELKSSTVR
ncbi:MAG: A/G-specific adenine glycosylase [Abditibacteriota bacterium]|nr:A/G-specific adenine glycosylase [Abditibacteriota bacterium]